MATMGIPYFEDTKTEEKSYLNEMTKEAYKNQRLWFGSETSPYDPRSKQKICDNAMRASEYGIKKPERILPNSTWNGLKACMKVMLN
jgi:hypothetical protein